MRLFRLLQSFGIDRACLFSGMARGRPPSLLLPVSGIAGVRSGYYELRSCPVWRRGRNKYDYNLFRPGLRRPALEWHCVGTRRYLQSKVAGGKKLYLHRLAAFLIFRHRSHRRADFSEPLREVHHFDLNERNNCWRNLRWWTKSQHLRFHRGG